MPVILRAKGYEFSFAMFDLDEPVHVHVRSGRKQAKFWVDPPSIAWSQLATVKTAPNHGRSRPIAIPAATPDLTEVHELAEKLHTASVPYHGRAWGWEITYEPEIDEDKAAVDVPDGPGGFTTKLMPLWSPASFTIGASGIWFYSLMWENGADQPPVAFLDDRGIVAQT